MFCTHNMGCTINQRSIPFGYFLHLFFKVNKVFCVFCSFHNCSWQSRRQGVTGYYNGWRTDTLRDLVEQDPEILPLLVKLSSHNKQNFQFWEYSLQASDYQDFQNVRLMEFCCNSHYLSLLWGSWIHFTPAHPIT